MLANQYLNLAKTPISAEDFCGDDVRYSAEFEALEVELAKADCLHATTGPDWAAVREGSESLLRQHSKDLRAAVWLTWSLYQSESFGGLQAGIASLVYLCTHHWEALHPRRPRTRQAAFGWLIPRLEQAVARAVSNPECIDAATVSSLKTQLQELDTCLTSHLVSEAPLLLPLCRRLDELTARSRQATGPDTGPGSATANPQPTVASVTPIHTQKDTAPAAIGSARDAHRMLRAMQEQTRMLCDWWLDQSATDPRAIRLSRTLLWLPIEALPEHDGQQKTPLRGLPADRISTYAERLEQGRSHEQLCELLRDLENSVARSPFWLDGQWMVWQCLDALGAGEAQRELEVQVQLLLRRLPGLEQLRFHDGSPFADEQTQAWLAEVVTAPANAPTVAAAGTPDDQQLPWDEALKAAAMLWRKENLKAGVAMLKQGMQTASSERQRFHWQLAQARLCHMARHYELAAYQLEGLYQTLHETRLDRWEPKLAISVLQLLHDCYERLPRKQGGPERRQDIHQRLCQLDLEAALDQTYGS
ncbi:MAG: type VI secretion system protein TssA [Pseudomonadaceae bacterium]